MRREHRAAVDPIMASHGGRIVKTTGDGVLVEFPSIVAAVECAVAVQTRMAERNADLLDLIEPGRACRREVKLHVGVGLEPGLVLLVGVEVVEDDVKLAVRKRPR